MKDTSIKYETSNDGEIKLEMVGEWVHLLSGIAYIIDKLNSNSDETIDETFDSLKSAIIHVRNMKATGKKNEKS